MIEEAWQHTGYRIYYSAGMDKRWFEGQEPTPWQSVFYSDFADFVKLYAIEKARI